LQLIELILQIIKTTKMKKFIIVASCFIFLSVTSILKAQTGPSQYRIANKFPVEGDGGWDYLNVDESTGRIFISHGTVVNVIDEKDGKLIGTIPDTKGVHGIAIATDLNKAFISNGRDSSVTIINLSTLAFITKVTVTGQNPDAIIYDPFSHNVFTYNGRTANATVIDGLANNVIATIKLDGKPENSVSNGKGKVYVNIEDMSEIAVINSLTNIVEHTWSISPGEEASGLALDNENHRLFTVCSNKLMVILDASSGRVITSLPIGDGSDGAVFDPALKRAYSSNGEGTLTVVQEISPDEFKVLENVTTQRGARTLTVNKKTHHIFMSAAEYEVASPSAGNTNRRPAIKPGTFVILDVAPVK
jgi:DNA-binding beta-propeller fold protein YncE